MAKCKICGKRGLFLRVDKQSRCNECSGKEETTSVMYNIKESIQKQIDPEFDVYYANILTLFKSQQGTIDVGNDPITALKFVPILENKIDECEQLKKEIHSPQYEKKIGEKLIKSITYRDDFNKRHGIGEIKEIGISVYHGVSTKEISTEKILADIDKKIKEYIFRWKSKIKSIKACAEFQEKLNSIKNVEVEISDTKHKKLVVSELDGLIKYTNITPKTSYDRIGSFVVIDTETTGLSSTKDAVVEVAAIKFEDWVPIERYQTLINPGKSIPADASAVNNITDDMVCNAPTFLQIIDSLDSFIGKYNIVGHNLPFDLKFLYRNGYNFATKKRHYYDTCEIAKKILKKPKMKWDKEYEEYVINENYDYDVEDYKLTTLCDYYGIRDNSFAHRALSDAYATGLLFECLAKDKIDY